MRRFVQDGKQQQALVRPGVFDATRDCLLAYVRLDVNQSSAGTAPGLSAAPISEGSESCHAAVVFFRGAGTGRGPVPGLPTTEPDYRRVDAALPRRVQRDLRRRADLRGVADRSFDLLRGQGPRARCVALDMFELIRSGMRCREPTVRQRGCSDTAIVTNGYSRRYSPAGVGR